MTNPMMPIAMAPTMTKASDGSHRPARSRNPSTFTGLIIPDTSSPIPKTRPATKAKNAYIGRRYARMWRVANTVANPAAMNARVATSERGESRDRPHTP